VNDRFIVRFLPSKKLIDLTLTHTGKGWLIIQIKSFILKSGFHLKNVPDGVPEVFYGKGIARGGIDQVNHIRNRHEIKAVDHDHTKRDDVCQNIEVLIFRKRGDGEMKSILASTNDAMKDREGFFASIPDIIRSLEIFLRKGTVFNSLHDPGKKRTGYERIKALGLTETVKFQGPLPVVHPDFWA
jgi:hypothetical protein